MEQNMKDLGNKMEKPPQYSAEKGKEALNRVTDKFENLGGRAAEKVQGMHLGEYYDTAINATQETMETATGFVKKFPVSSVLGAAAVGVLIGMLAKRNPRH